MLASVLPNTIQYRRTPPYNAYAILDWLYNINHHSFTETDLADLGTDSTRNFVVVIHHGRTINWYLHSVLLTTYGSCMTYTIVHFNYIQKWTNEWTDTWGNFVLECSVVYCHGQSLLLRTLLISVLWLYRPLQGKIKDINIVEMVTLSY